MAIAAALRISFMGPEYPAVPSSNPVPSSVWVERDPLTRHLTWGGGVGPMACACTSYRRLTGGYASGHAMAYESIGQNQRRLRHCGDFRLELVASTTGAATSVCDALPARGGVVGGDGGLPS